MEPQESGSPKLQDRVEEFKKKNPQIAKALELFDMTLDQYYGSLTALDEPTVYVSNSTQERENE